MFASKSVKSVHTALAGLAVTAALAACGSTTASPSSSASASKVAIPASSQCSGAAAKPGAQVMATSDYYMVLNVGAAEPMYTAAEAKGMAPDSGEVMIAGKMMEATPSSGDGMPGMSGSTDPATRHVEVAICNKQTGQAVAGAMPTMTMGTSGTSMAAMPVAEMQGIGQGAADTHYGNNMPMTAGQQYSVTTTLNGQSATFTVTAP